MSALHLEAPEPIKSRPSVCLNMISSNMLEEYNETVAEIQGLIARLHVANTIAAELRIHLQIQGIL